MDYEQQPRATYCRPEIASIGLTEAQATERGHTLKIGKVPFRAIGKAIIGGEYEGFAKVIADAKTDDLLGVHIIGPHATDLIAEASVATLLEATPGRSGWPRTRTRPSPRCWARPRWPSTARRSTSDPPGGRTRAMAVTKGKDSLGASVGLTDADLLAMYRMLGWPAPSTSGCGSCNRAGKIPFVICGQGHEGAQVGIAWAFAKGHDWMAPFYRSIATCMTFGMSARDIMTAQFATAGDASSGGRQMPGHYGSREHNLVSVSSPVATQVLHAVGIALAAKIRKTGQVAMASIGEGSSNQGDVHEALNFAAIHKLPFIFVVENNGYAISVPAGDAGLGRRCRRPGGRATASPASSSTAPTSWPATPPRGRRSRGPGRARARPSSRRR